MASLDQVVDQILEVFKEVSGNDSDITKDTNLGDLEDEYGFDEIDLIERLDPHFGTVLPPVEVLSDSFYWEFSIKEYAEVILVEINDQTDG